MFARGRGRGLGSDVEEGRVIIHLTTKRDVSGIESIAYSKAFVRAAGADVPILLLSRIFHRATLTFHHLAARRGETQRLGMEEGKGCRRRMFRGFLARKQPAPSFPSRDVVSHRSSISVRFTRCGCKRL